MNMIIVAFYFALLSGTKNVKLLRV